MNPESICVSLETAKKLKKAGWNKETVFVWKDCEQGAEVEVYEQQSMSLKSKIVYPTPTSSEIELPPDTECWKMAGNNEFICIQRDSGDADSYWYDIFEEKYPNNEKDFEPQSFESKSEVEAKALMWLYLKEEGLI